MKNKKIPVIISIETKRTQLLSPFTDDGPEVETLNSTEIGTLKRTKTGYRLDIESAESLTVIDTDMQGTVSMNVDGQLSSSLVFINKKTCTGTYCNEESLLQVMTYTYNLKNSLHEPGGSLILDYEIMLGGSICERCCTTYTPVELNAPGIC